MPQLIILPNQDFCPDGTVIEANTGTSVCRALLDKAWGLDPDSRLSCQAIVSEEDLVIEIPKYTINQVSENH